MNLDLRPAMDDPQPGDRVKAEHQLLGMIEGTVDRIKDDGRVVLVDTDRAKPDVGLNVSPDRIWPAD